MVFLLALAGCAQGAAVPEGGQVGAQPAAAELTPLTLCTSSVSGTQLVAWYAYEKGLFEKYGLAVQLLPVDSGSNAALALIAGEADICQVAGSAVANAVAGGEDLALVAGFFNRHIYKLIAQKDIRSAEELAGGSVGITSIGGSTDTALRAAARHLGLDPENDLTMLALGSQGNRLTALEVGEVSAVLLAEPLSARAEELGYTTLLDLSDLPDAYQHVGLATTRETIEQDREKVLNALRAVTHAMIAMRRDKEGVKSVLATYLEMDPQTDSKILDQAYDALVLKQLSADPYPTMEGLDAIITEEKSLNPDMADVSADDLVDLSLIKELEAEGFFADLLE